MKKDLIIKLHGEFETCAHKEEGIEYWLARDLQRLLGYDRWENFLNAIDRARTACINSKQNIDDHFRDVTKMVTLGSGAPREISDIKLTRYACYLIAQNGDPRKPEIAFAQTYFAIQTRKQEHIEQRIAEWERLQAREKLTLSEKELSRMIYERGIDEKGFGRIRSKGDTALFGNYTTQDMKDKMGVPSNRALADFLPTITIKAKDFANEVTNVQVVNQDLRSEEEVTKEHVKNNLDVRKLLTDRNIIPEQLPAAEDVKKVKRRLKSEARNLPKQDPSLQTSINKE